MHHINAYIHHNTYITLHTHVIYIQCTHTNAHGVQYACINIQTCMPTYAHIYTQIHYTYFTRIILHWIRLDDTTSHALHKCIDTYIHYIHACMHTLHTIHTYIHTYITYITYTHAYITFFLHTYIHTYTHTSTTYIHIIHTHITLRYIHT